ncbi:MAG: hypothetical protein ACKO3S_08030 [bacterium]
MVTSRRRATILLVSLALLLGSAPARAADEPVRIASFAGTPSDSSERRVFMQAFHAAFDRATLDCEFRDADAWSGGVRREHPFARVDVNPGPGAWTLELSVRFPPEVRIPAPRGSEARARRTTFRAARGFVVVATVTPPATSTSGQPFGPERTDLVFPDARRVVVPSERLPGGAYDFPFADAGRAAARLALEALLRARGDLSDQERVALAPAARAEPEP